MPLKPPLSEALPFSRLSGLMVRTRLERPKGSKAKQTSPNPHVQSASVPHRPGMLGAETFKSFLCIWGSAYKSIHENPKRIFQVFDKRNPMPQPAEEFCYSENLAETAPKVGPSSQVFPILSDATRQCPLIPSSLNCTFSTPLHPHQLCSSLTGRTPPPLSELGCCLHPQTPTTANSLVLPGSQLWMYIEMTQVTC